MRDRMKEYVLYVDDTGFNSNEKKSLALKDELTTCAGVLIDKDEEEYFASLVQGLGNLLKDRYGTNEFHFTEIYNRQGAFKEIQFEETLDMLDMFTDFFQMFDLKIFVHTQTGKQKDKQKCLNSMIDDIAPQLHLPKGEKTQSLLLSYFDAKRYVETELKDGKIVKIVSDEGLRKNGAAETIQPQDVELEFKSSKECPLLQLADFGAWFLTRTKHILDKASARGHLGEADSAVIALGSKMADCYVNLSKRKINLDHLDSFDYDKLHQEVVFEKEQKEKI